MKTAPYTRYKGKGEHSVKELEQIIEQREDEIHLLKSEPNTEQVMKLAKWWNSGKTRGEQYDLCKKYFFATTKEEFEVITYEDIEYIYLKENV